MWYPTVAWEWYAKNTASRDASPRAMRQIVVPTHQMKENGPAASGRTDAVGQQMSRDRSRQAAVYQLERDRCLSPSTTIDASSSAVLPWPFLPQGSVSLAVRTRSLAPLCLA